MSANEGDDDRVIRPTDVGPLVGEDRWWAEKAAELQRDALPSLRTSAEKWAATLTGVLSVVGLAALIEGADTFDDLQDLEQTLAKLAFFGAGVLALVATGLAAQAAHQSGKKL